MSIEVHAVQRVRAISESTFGADATSSPGLASFIDVPVREGSATVELTPVSLDPMQNVQRLDQYRLEVLGPRSAKLTMTLNLAPTGTAAASGTSAVTGALGTLLKASMGGEAKGAGTTFASGSTASVVNLTSAAAFAAGGSVGWVNASGLYEVREIESIATNAVTLKYAFSGSPTAAQVAYNAAVYYLTENPTESLQFLVAGAESDDRWLLVGGQLTGVSITLDPTGKALPAIQFTYEFATYLESDETAASVTGAIGVATYSNYTPIVGHAGDMRAPNVGQVTMLTSHRVHASAIAWQPKFKFERVTSPSGVETVLQWRRVRVAPVIEGSWTVPFQDLTWTAARDARTSKYVTYQMGRTAGQTVLLSAPTVQIVAPQRVADAVGIAGQTVNWKGRCDEDVGVSTTDLALSPLRIVLA